MDEELDERSAGFTLIELLVVMIIISLLAAIAVPVFLSQRRKAYDTSTRADTAALGKEMTSYFVDGTGAIQAFDVTTKSGFLVVTDDGVPQYRSELKISQGTQLATTSLIESSNSTSWCVALTNQSGLTKTFHYSAAAGLATGPC